MSLGGFFREKNLRKAQLEWCLYKMLWGRCCVEKWLDMGLVIYKKMIPKGMESSRGPNKNTQLQLSMQLWCAEVLSKSKLSIYEAWGRVLFQEVAITLHQEGALDVPSPCRYVEQKQNSSDKQQDMSHAGQARGEVIPMSSLLQGRHNLLRNPGIQRKISLQIKRTTLVEKQKLVSYLLYHARTKYLRLTSYKWRGLLLKFQFIAGSRHSGMAEGHCRRETVLGMAAGSS